MDEPLPRRRRDRVRTRAKVLESAIQAFSEVGYAEAGIRDIAERAGVTSPMVIHYFGSKIGLFEAALVESMSSQALFDGPRASFGRDMMAALSNPANDIRTPALIVLATGMAETRAISAEVTERQGVSPLAEWLGGPDCHARAVEISILAISYVLFTRQVPLVQQGSDTDAKVIDWMADAIQRIVDRS